MQTFIPSRGLRASLLFAALAAATVSSAATLTYKFDLGDYQTTKWSKSVALTKFDPAFGTLTGYEIFVDGAIKATQTYVSQSDSSINGIVGKSGAAFYLVSPTNVDLVSQAIAASQSVSLNPHTTFASTLAQGSSFSYASRPTDSLTNVTGLGTMNYRIDTEDTSLTTGTGQFTALYTTAAKASGSIVYTYNAAPVPEPASIAAFGLGVVGLIRRKQGARK